MYTRTQTRTERVLADVLEERRRQVAKHGVQTDLPDGTGPDKNLLRDLGRVSYLDGVVALSEYPNGPLSELARRRCQEASRNEGGDGSITFEHILTEEWAEAVAEDDKALLRQELIQVAAVAVQWCEKLDLEAEGRP